MGRFGNYSNTEEYLLEKGMVFRKIGLGLFICFGAGIALFLLICFISLLGWGRIYLFTGFGTFFSWLAAVATSIGAVGGIPFYCIGLHYIGLGQIIKNTDHKHD